MAVTARIGGVEAGGVTNGGMEWEIQYDDQTRNVTATASGQGFCFVTAQVTTAVSRTVAFKPTGAGSSVNLDLAARMSAADFQAAADGSVGILASNVNANQVSRIVGKSGAVGGLQFTSEWTRF
jgi:hypothetical protein